MITLLWMIWIIGIDWTKVPSRLYTISLIITIVGYMVLIIFPRQSWANFWFSGIILPALLGAVYTVVLLITFFAPHYVQQQTISCAELTDISQGKAFKCDESSVHVSVATDFLTLNGLRRLFLKDGLLLSGFLDLLLAPLALAAWMTRKAAQIRMPYIFLLPCLLLTFAFPGTGVTVFVILSGLGGRLAQMARFEGQPPTNTMPVFARPLDV
ncbi:MAG TPA: abscisic acid-deficient protein Aba4 family protein [Pyrinomonadaceae bacterium]|jgi:hypothetical protein|nr:abscisic acid-deficient protein Aba4 family protein [Pyrinomonadaceae bacterium]